MGYLTIDGTTQTVKDTNGNELAEFEETVAAINHLLLRNAAAGNAPSLEAAGDGTNVNLNLKPKGTGGVLLQDGDGNEVLLGVRVSTAVNYVSVTNSATGGGPLIEGAGDDAAVDITIRGKGAGGVQVSRSGGKLGFFGATLVTKPTALTAANAGTLNTGDATSDTIIGNMRTRINELETKLQALGLIA